MGNMGYAVVRLTCGLSTLHRLGSDLRISSGHSRTTPVTIVSVVPFVDECLDILLLWLPARLVSMKDKQ
jgi:hypothetical protein